MMKKYTTVAAVVLLLFSWGLMAQEKPEPSYLKAFHSISSHELMGYVAEMSKDKYKGRLTGSPEFIEIANWTADYLKEWGVTPAGDNGSYFQWFDLPWTDVLEPGSITLEIPVAGGSVITKGYELAEDYYPGSNSDSGEVTAEVVYVGWGITAPELGYDDYAGMDVNGKIVMMCSEVPISSKSEDFIKWVPYSLHTYKLTNASKHGAAGVIYVNPILNPNSCFNKGLVYLHVDSDVAEDVFAGTGKTYQETIDKISETLKPASFVTNKKATLKAKTKHYPTGSGCNIMGLIPGSDPELKDEVILVGGHIDGVGDLGDIIIPGSYDNASAVALMLGAVRAMAESPEKPKRSILFIFFGAEESALVGSRFYCENPVFPKEKTVCLFNMDMIGVGSGLAVSGGASYPLINRHFEEANSRLIHRPYMATEAWSGGVARPRRDSVIFNRAGFRTLEFSNFVPRGETRSRTYYHHPKDDVDTLDPEVMEDLTRMAFVGLMEMANAEKLIEDK